MVPTVVEPTRLSRHLNWGLALMRILDVVIEYGGSAHLTVCTSEASTGISGDMLQAVMAMHKHEAGKWRLAAELDVDMPKGIDTPTLVCRMLDMLSRSSDGFSNPIYPTVWSEYGISDKDKQSILTVYLIHSHEWFKNVCEDVMLLDD